MGPDPRKMAALMMMKRGGGSGIPAAAMSGAPGMGGAGGGLPPGDAVAAALEQAQRAGAMGLPGLPPPSSAPSLGSPAQLESGSQGGDPAACPGVEELLDLLRRSPDGGADASGAPHGDSGMDAMMAAAMKRAHGGVGHPGAGARGPVPFARR